MAVALTMCASDIFSSVHSHRPSPSGEERAVRFRSKDGHYETDLMVFGRISNVDVEYSARLIVRAAVVPANWRAEYMSRFLDLSIHDLAIMVGLGCFSGSAMSVAWSLLSASPVPKEIAVSAALIGFVLGKLAADRAEGRQHA